MGENKALQKLSVLLKVRKSNYISKPEITAEMLWALKHDVSEK